jgi:hypothetical protein
MQPDTSFDSETRYAETISRRKVEIGDEVCIMYGQRSNQELFQFSGFVDPEVFQYDCIKIYLAFNESDKLFETKCEMAKQAGLKW